MQLGLARPGAVALSRACAPGVIDLVISHGGRGTAATLGAGVAVLCMPFRRDSPGVARRVQSLSLGIVLEPGSDADAIAAAVAGMLADTALRQCTWASASSVQRFGELDLAVRHVYVLTRCGR